MSQKEGAVKPRFFSLSTAKLFFSPWQGKNPAAFFITLQATLRASLLRLVLSRCSSNPPFPSQTPTGQAKCLLLIKPPELPSSYLDGLLLSTACPERRWISHRAGFSLCIHWQAWKPSNTLRSVLSAPIGAGLSHIIQFVYCCDWSPFGVYPPVNFLHRLVV